MTPVAKRVLLVTRDLLFRSKLEHVVAAAGAEVTRDEASCDLAVVELGEAAADRVGPFVRRGIPTLAYSAHVRPELLRAARAQGATAVPNSEVEATLRAWLQNAEGRPTRSAPRDSSSA